MTMAQDTLLAPPVRSGLHPRIAFGSCAGLLAAVAMLAWGIPKWLGLYLDKEPVPLHKPLDQLDKSKLGPYRFLHAQGLPGEVVEALGTKEFIQWYLEDPRRSAGDPLRYPVLFVTYYTGGRTNVPHTPERCHLGAGFVQEGAESVAFTVPSLIPGAEPVPVAAKFLLFSKPGLIGMQQQTVTYTFYANCEYAAERNWIRLALMKPGLPKAFFSKVEVTFNSGDMGGANPDPQAARAAAQEVLQTVLPVLMREHWPRQEELTGPQGQPSK